MSKSRYRIYAVRYDRFTPDAKEIDRLMCNGSAFFNEAKNDFLRIMYNANFSKEEYNAARKKLNHFKAKDFEYFGVFTEDLHGQLGPGGYLLVKEEEP